MNNIHTYINIYTRTQYYIFVIRQFSPPRYGQLSGMVEPIAGVLGAFAIAVAEPALPYALAFAAGAMVYVVMDDIIPEAQTG